MPLKIIMHVRLALVLSFVVITNCVQNDELVLLQIPMLHSVSTPMVKDFGSSFVWFFWRMQSVKVTRSKIKTNSSPLKLFGGKRIYLQRLENAKPAYFLFFFFMKCFPGSLRVFATIWKQNGNCRSVLPLHVQANKPSPCTYLLC